MQLEGNTITHKTFGRGIVTGMSDNIITISFSHGEKKFLYPDAFSEFLVLHNNRMQKRIKDMLFQHEQETAHCKQIEQEKQDRLNRLRTLRLSPNSQAAFGFLENSKQDVFSSWTVFTGHYLSGYSKGKPRIPNKLKPNSVCLLTECPNGTSEEKRKIIGAFMMRDDFDGALCTDGKIHSHENYKIKLQEDQSLLFWNYFDESDCPKRWGKTEFKYFSTEIMHKILYDMLTLLADSEHHETITHFYNYFCNVNRLTSLLEE
ncbi:hypothetical protein CS063_01945 [Sporanaerobium hydrogeniformans]|uniref:Uncharacterized protein n=1 Tax=Sporanaerobium hydrogeniformans TaxID=3072179 RepID=A0AC61DI29_9FIRM|nr:hypothetical protein [Sporanaerobium hydrogeniformans]PHV72261.1 hypothetical protein CS063_01945 [Sporanaerobium hydrogeniformans]